MCQTHAIADHTATKQANPAVETAATVQTTTGSRRRKLWELEDRAFCPVIGVCLPIPVLRRVVNKTFRGHNVDTDYALHSGAVGQCGSRTPLAEGMQRELEQRYALAIRQTASVKTTEALCHWWYEASQKDLAGPLWATLTHPRCSADLERQVESESVLRLLDGAADAASVASRLGLPQGPARVIAVRTSLESERHTALLLAFEQATAGFGWSRPGRSALADNTVYTVLPGEDAAPARRWVSELRASLPAHAAVVAGISAVAQIAELTAARQEADECLAPIDQLIEKLTKLRDTIKV